VAEHLTQFVLIHSALALEQSPHFLQVHVLYTLLLVSQVVGQQLADVLATLEAASAGVLLEATSVLVHVQVECYQVKKQHVIRMRERLVEPKDSFDRLEVVGFEVFLHELFQKGVEVQEITYTFLLLELWQEIILLFGENLFERVESTREPLILHVQIREQLDVLVPALFGVAILSVVRVLHEERELHAEQPILHLPREVVLAEREGQTEFVDVLVELLLLLVFVAQVLQDCRDLAVEDELVHALQVLLFLDKLQVHLQFLVAQRV